jgi:hypothetical protein
MGFVYHLDERFKIVLACHEQTVAPQRCDCNRLLFKSNASLGHYRFGWNRFTKMVDRIMPKRGNTLELPFPDDSAED